MCLNSNIRRCMLSNETHMSIFYPLEVVGRGSETQLQVGANCNYLIYASSLWDDTYQALPSVIIVIIFYIHIKLHFLM